MPLLLISVSSSFVFICNFFTVSDLLSLPSQSQNQCRVDITHAICGLGPGIIERCIICYYQTHTNDNDMYLLLFAFNMIY